MTWKFTGIALMCVILMVSIDECTTDSDCPSTRCIREPVYMEFRYTATCSEGTIDRYNEVTVISQYDRKVCEKPR